MLRKFVTTFLLLLFMTVCMPLEVTNASLSNRFVGPVRGKVSSDFGWRVHPITGRNHFHTGLDIAANQGSPIFALQEGIVIYSGYMSGYGNAVVVEHKYSEFPEVPVIRTLYGHNAQNLVKVGDNITRGSIVATVGSTGRSTGPHLHFEVHYQNRYINPIDYLTKLPGYLTYVARKRELLARG